MWEGRIREEGCGKGASEMKDVEEEYQERPRLSRRPGTTRFWSRFTAASLYINNISPS